MRCASSRSVGIWRHAATANLTHPLGEAASLSLIIPRFTQLPPSQSNEISLDHIESRPSKTSNNYYEFFVSTKDDPEKVRRVVQQLQEELSSKATVLDTNPTTQNPAWFPRNIRDLVCCVRRNSWFEPLGRLTFVVSLACTRHCFFLRTCSCTAFWMLVPSCSRTIRGLLMPSTASAVPCSPTLP